MQRAAYLAIAFVLFAGLTACSRSKPYAPLSDEEKAKYENVRQQVFIAHPELKTREDELKGQFYDKDKIERRTRGDKEEARRNVQDIEGQIYDEAYKIDPSVETTYFRLQGFSKPQLEGLEEYEYDYKPHQTDFWIWAGLILRVSPFLATAVGLILLFRTPTWAGANFLLISISLPVVFFGHETLRAFDAAYIWPMDGIWDGDTTPQRLEELHHEVERFHLEFIPSVVLYLILCIRLLLKGRKEKKTHSEVAV